MRPIRVSRRASTSSARVQPQPRALGKRALGPPLPSVRWAGQENIARAGVGHVQGQRVVDPAAPQLRQGHHAARHGQARGRRAPVVAASRRSGPGLLETPRTTPPQRASQPPAPRRARHSSHRVSVAGWWTVRWPSVPGRGARARRDRHTRAPASAASSRPHGPGPQPATGTSGWPPRHPVDRGARPGRSGSTGRSPRRRSRRIWARKAAINGPRPGRAAHHGPGAGSRSCEGVEQRGPGVGRLRSIVRLVLRRPEPEEGDHGRRRDDQAPRPAAAASRSLRGRGGDSMHGHPARQV